MWKKFILLSRKESALKPVLYVTVEYTEDDNVHVVHVSCTILILCQMTRKTTGENK